MPVGLEQDPASDLERDRHCLAEPGLRVFETSVLEGEDRETGDEVLDLEVAVPGPLEPSTRLEAEAVAPLRSAPGGRDPPPPPGRLRPRPVAAHGRPPPRGTAGAR